MSCDSRPVGWPDRRRDGAGGMGRPGLRLACGWVTCRNPRPGAGCTPAGRGCTPNREIAKGHGEAGRHRPERDLLSGEPTGDLAGRLCCSGGRPRTALRRCLGTGGRCGRVSLAGLDELLAGGSAAGQGASSLFAYQIATLFRVGEPDEGIG